MTDLAKNFVAKAAPEYWYTYAHELADTADQIYRSSKRQFVAYLHEYGDGSTKTERRPLVSRPVLLMYGICFENMIKALLISEEPHLLNGGRLSKHLLGHDLVKLADRLKSLVLSHSERTLLAMLSDVVPYHGRYPVPRNAEDMKPEIYISEDVYAMCREFFDRLEMQLYRLNYKGIDAPEGVRFPNLRLAHLDEKADFITEELKMTSRDFLQQFRDAEGDNSR